MNAMWRLSRGQKEPHYVNTQMGADLLDYIAEASCLLSFTVCGYVSYVIMSF